MEKHIELMIEHARKGKLSEATVHAIKKTGTLIAEPKKKHKEWNEAHAEGEKLHGDNSQCLC